MSKPLSEQVATLETYLAEALAENRYLEAENDELRRGQGRWPKLGPAVAPTVPRVITADELREGQLICIHRGHGWGVRAIGEFQGVEGDVVTIKTGGSGTFTESTKFHTIVLLEDAPEPEPVTAEAIRQSEPGSTWERDHHEAGGVYEWTGKKLWWHFVPHDDSGDYIDDVDQGGDWSRSTAAPRGDYSTPPRLTVHKLNVAPAGTEVAYGAAAALKRRDGRWGVGILRPPISAEELLARITEADGLEDATLHHPERGDHE